MVALWGLVEIDKPSSCISGVRFRWSTQKNWLFRFTRHFKLIQLNRHPRITALRKVPARASILPQVRPKLHCSDFISKEQLSALQTYFFVGRSFEFGIQKHALTARTIFKDIAWILTGPDGQKILLRQFDQYCHMETIEDSCTPTLTTMPVSCSSQIFCSGCGSTILDRFYLKALDKLWHEDCLKCACCDCRLGEVGSSCFTKANLILCRRDYLR